MCCNNTYLRLHAQLGPCANHSHSHTVFMSPWGYRKVNLHNHIRGRRRAEWRRRGQRRATDFFNISGKSDISQAGCVTAEPFGSMARHFWPEGPFYILVEQDSNERRSLRSAELADGSSGQVIQLLNGFSHCVGNQCHLCLGRVAAPCSQALFNKPF